MNTDAVVFDFDCTLSSIHLFKTLRGWKQWKQILKQTFSDDKIKDMKEYPNDTSAQLIRIILNGEQIDRKKKLELLRNATFFCYYIMGGSKRINMLKNMLFILYSAKVDMFIASFGYVDEIMAVLNAVNISLLNCKGIHGKLPTGIIGMYKPYHNMYEKMVLDKFGFIKTIKNIHNYKKIIYIDDFISKEIMYKFSIANICTIIPIQQESKGITIEDSKKIYEKLNLKEHFKNNLNLIIGLHYKTVMLILPSLCIDLFIKTKTYEMGDYYSYNPGEKKENRICVDINCKNVIYDAKLY